MDEAPSAIDRATLDELEHAIGDDRGFLRELIESYLDDAPRLIATARDGIAAGDVESTNRAAHTLKSNSATVGALGLSAMARELQTMTMPATTSAEDLAAPEISALLEVIAFEFNNVHHELDAMVPPESDNS